MRHAILPAIPEDAPFILALQRLAYQSEARLYGAWDIPPLTQSLEELRAEFGRLAFLKALAEDGSIVGSVRAGLDGDACRIGRLVVHPDRQRQGLGSALLAAAEALFPQAGRCVLFTGHKSEGNLRLYRRHGYAETGRAQAGPHLVIVTLEKPGPGAGR